MQKEVENDCQTTHRLQPISSAAVGANRAGWLYH